MKARGKPSKKLLIILQGSEQQDVRRLFGYGAEASRFGFDLLLINKFAFDDQDKYWETNCMKRRVDDVCAVINDVAKTVYGGSLEKVMLFGGSEGGSVAPVVARRLPQITHMILLGASCRPQCKDFEVLITKGFKRSSNIFRACGIMNVDELRQKCDEIRNSTDSLRGWLGYSYKYWKQALDDTTAYAALSKSTIPVLVISGGDDESTPAEGVKPLRDSLGGKSNFTFEFIPEADHRMVGRQGQNLMPQVYRTTILPWGRKSGAF
jgi:pimeloyl-ACP methyl ester carboxylesterase